MHPKTDRPDLAAQQNFQMTKDPTLGYPPIERNITAFEIAKARLAKNSSTHASIAGVNWTERGPDNVGGRTRAIMFDPNDSLNRKVWAGGVSGGLWYNNDITNPGSEWRNVDDFFANLAIGSIAFDPSNTNNFYLGTGEGWFNGDAVRGAGIWKSDDAGLTWNRLTSTLGFHFVQKIVVTSTGTILVAVTVATSPTAGGIFRSIDQGSTFSQMISGRGADLEIAADGDIFASTGRIFSPGKLFKSVDDGLIWNEITSIPAGGERIEIATAPSDADRVYAIASNEIDIQWFSKSSDGGVTWEADTIPFYLGQNCVISTDDFTRGQAFYDLILGVHPLNKDIIIAGGINLHRSEDGGITWGASGDGEPVSYWTGFCKPYVHADQHAIVFRPGASDEVIIGNDGGIFFSKDLGSSDTPSFIPRNKGYNITQFYSVTAANISSSNYFLAGSQDNGTQQFNNNGVNSTAMVTGGDGGYCFVDQDDPMLQIASFVGNTYFRSIDGGASFSEFINDQESGRFINPTDYDSDNNILYAAGNDDQYFRYSGIDNSIDRDTLSVNLNGEQISNLKVSPYTSNRLIIGTGNGLVFIIDNAHTAPIVTEITGSLPPFFISSIEIGADDDQLLVTYSNFGVFSMWETLNGGTTWTDKEGNLPDIPVRWALYNPNNRNEVLLATDVGIWSTDDLSQVFPIWDPTNADLANVRCDMIKYRPADGLVVVATHGRGLFTSDVFVTTAAADFKSNTRVAYLGQPVKFIDLSIGTSNTFSWDFGDGNTSTLRNPINSYSQPGSYSVSLTISNGMVSETKTNYIQVLPDRMVSYLLSNGGNFEVSSSDFVEFNIQGTGFALGNSLITGKDGTSSGDSAWVIGITSSLYDANSEAHLYTPNFNFSNPGAYSFEFKANYSFEAAFDGFVVEYSVNRGDTWYKLDDTLSLSWHDMNTDFTNIVFAPGTSFFSGNTGGSFVTKTADASFLSGFNDVAFRFVFRSDPAVEDIGLAIDDVIVLGPTTPAFSADNTSVCLGDTITFTSSSSGIITSYTWKFGAGASPSLAVGEGPHEVVYSSLGLFTSKLTINGNLFEEKIDYITVNPFPLDINLTLESDTVCVGTSAFVLMDNTQTGVTYEFFSDTTSLGSVPGGGNLNVEISPIISETTLTIIATDDVTQCFLELTDKPVVATREGPTAEISQGANNNLFATTGGEAYQWNYQGDPISGAEDSVYSPPLMGVYTVEITKNGCTTLSNDFNVLVVELDDSHISKELRLYPNPITSIFSLELSDPVVGEGKIVIYNQLGKNVYQSSDYKSDIHYKKEIDLSELKPGIYIVKFTISDKVYLNRLIKN